MKKGKDSATLTRATVALNSTPAVEIITQNIGSDKLNHDQEFSIAGTPLVFGRASVLDKPFSNEFIKKNKPTIDALYGEGGEKRFYGKDKTNSFLSDQGFKDLSIISTLNPPTEEEITGTPIIHSFRFTHYLAPRIGKLWVMLDDREDSIKEYLSELLAELLSYPKAFIEFIDWLKDPSRTLEVVNKLLDGKIRWARDFYKDTNYRFTKADLYTEVLKQFSSWKREEGRDILTFLVVNQIALDIKPTGYMRDNFSVSIPLRKRTLKLYDNTLDICRVGALQEILELYYSLSDKIATKGDGNIPVFSSGTVMLETDLRDHLMLKRRALTALIYDLQRLEQSVAITEQLAAVKIYGVRPQNWDVIEEAVNHEPLDRLAANFTFAKGVLCETAILYNACSLSSPSIELRKHVDRVAHYYFKSTLLNMKEIKSFREEVYFSTTSDPTGEITGAVALKIPSDVDSNSTILRPGKSVLGPWLKVYEAQSFSHSSSLIHQMYNEFSSIAKPNRVVDEISSLVRGGLKVNGFYTNMDVSDLLLFYLACHDGDLKFTTGNKSLDGVGEIAGLSSLPRAVFPTEIPADHRVRFLGIRTLHGRYCFLNLASFFVAQNTLRENIPSQFTVFDTSLPEIKLAKDYGSGLEQIKRACADVEFSVEYAYKYEEDGKEKEVSLKSSYKLVHLLGDEVLHEAFIYQDDLPILVSAYNYTLLRNFRNIMMSLEAEDLNISPDDMRFYYKFDQEFLGRISKVAKGSDLFQRLLAVFTNDLLLQIARITGKQTKVFAGSIIREMRNEVGLALLPQVQIWLGNISEAELSDIQEACSRTANFRFEELF